MDEERLLQSISDMMDKKLTNVLKPINEQINQINEHLEKIDDRLERLEIVQKQTNKKLSDLKLDVQIAERDIRRDIHDLNDEMETVIAVLKMHDIIPM